ncbi:unnamed protein product [Tuber aestivum]|uniref:NACHT-NTPase and P-loop NTPases N-terminal domain-containing protein n=1 Tax=Tuber aestivum TaxID=59557 RepID=A0A292PR89_9PEZI|nr:unnamed protein product [Tuber aestivum]
MPKQKPSSAKALYRAAASARFLAEDVRAALLICPQLPHVDEIIRGVDEIGGVLDGVLGGLRDGSEKEGLEREVVERCRRTLDAVVGVVDLFLEEEVEGY